MTTVTDGNGFYSFDNLLLDEDYNGDGVGPEPTYISLSRPRAATYRPRSSALGSTPKDDSDDPMRHRRPAGPGHDRRVAAAPDPNDETDRPPMTSVTTRRTGGDRQLCLGGREQRRLQDAGEPGIPNVTVELRITAAADRRRTVTDADGGYLFDELAPGTYTVQVDGRRCRPA